MMHWRNHGKAALLAVLLTAAHTVLAEGHGPVPTPLVNAAAAYKARGPDAFLPTLVKGSRLEITDNASLAQAVDMLRAVESVYGTYLGLEMVATVPVTASTRIAYFVLRYEYGPLYGVADIYRTKHGEIVTSSNVNTQLNTIIPQHVIAGLRQ